MKVLLSGARSPVLLEWMKIFKNHQIILLDFTPFSLCFFSKKKFKKVILPSPKFDFYHFKKELKKLFKEVDFILPNCEEIFYFAMVRDEYLKDFPNEKNKFFFVETELLLALHNKFELFSYLSQSEGIFFPKTQLIKDKSQLKKINNLENFILKPVFSRFGSKTIKEINVKKIEKLELNSHYPYVLQEKIEGLSLCNYAIFENGKILAHSLYEPKYLINGSAGTYFTLIQDEKLVKKSYTFMQEFGLKYKLCGQFAFDFILKNELLYVLECNPRATSGVHFIGDKLVFEKNFKSINSNNVLNYRIGLSLFLFFSFDALRKGRFLELLKAYKKSFDVLKKVPIKASFISLFGLFYTAFLHKIKLSEASTFDIEFNGKTDERKQNFDYNQNFTHKFIKSFSQNSNTCIENLNVNFKLLKQEFKNHQIIFCISLNEKNKENAFSASLQGLIIDSAKDETKKLNSPLLKRFSLFLIKIFNPMVFYIDELVFIDNHFFSTNLYENYYENEEFLELCLKKTLQTLTKEKKALVFRSVNSIQNPRLFNFLRKEKFCPILTRQIYWIDDFSLLELSRDYKKDKKLLEQNSLYFQKADENANFIRIKELYDALYIEKYSKHNIRFCASYIQKMVKNHLIELYLLKEKDEILGCVGFLENQTSLTAPIIGYDTKSKKPLYRTLQAFILEQAKIKNKFLNESSGASTFKLLRKMQSNFEYSFIYTKHLSFSRRLCFKILSIISIYFYGKILKNFKL